MADSAMSSGDAVFVGPASYLAFSMTAMALASVCYFRQIPEGADWDGFASAPSEEAHLGHVYPMRCQVAPQVRISEDRTLPFADLANREVHAPHQCPILPLE
jgi:hypothetical protein